MPSAIYRVIWKAIRTRRQMICTYHDRARAACPHILGYTKDGREAVFVFQFAGDSSEGLPRGGAWRSFFLEGISDLQTQEGTWRTGTSHSQPQQYIPFVDVDVNIPETLTRPKPLPFGSDELLAPRGSK